MRTGVTMSRRLAPLLVAVGAAACELVSEPIRTTQGGIVVHAVLNPSVCTQLVFVEELLTGERRPGIGGDPADEIRMAGGIPVTNAQVAIRRHGSDSAFGRQRTLPGGEGTGVYEFISDRCPGSNTNRLAVSGGDTYELSVRTPDGRHVTGKTRIPRPTATPVHVGPRPYNVDTDSFRIETRPAEYASRYVLSVNNTRWGAISLRIETSSALVRGQVEYVDDFEQANVFWPGMLQRVVLAATDENYGDYVTTWSDPLTGRGQVHGVSGGFGLFGSVAPLGSVLLDVSADENHRIEGRWDRTNPLDSQLPYPILRLYIDDGRSLSANGETPLIGSMQASATSERVPLDGWLSRDGEVRLRYRRWPVRDVDLFGTINGQVLLLDDGAGNRMMFSWRGSQVG